MRPACGAVARARPPAIDLSLNSVDSYRDDLLKAQANPTSGGMRGLLLIGAITAALLAVLGSLVQAVMAARQRTTQFAIFRTLGMASRQLTRAAAW